MAEHSELVSEIPVVEKMTTAERLKHAKKRRNVQLKKFSHYDKQFDKDNKRRKMQSGKAKVNKKAKTSRVQFVGSIMLLESAARNDLNEVEELLRGSINTDVTNEDGLTALHQCCIDDLEDLLLLLIKYDANVNAQDSELWTPLHAAATCGHVHLCRILIDHGAELLAVNADGNMPYDICEDDSTLDYIESEMAKRGVTQELIDETRLSSEHKMLADMISVAQKGGDLEVQGRAGETPLHIAAANGYIQVSEFLLDHHVQVDLTDDDTWQPIHAAACWGHLPILELLVHQGADLEARTKNGETPLDICEDPEVRQRIMEMRDELKSHRTNRSRDLKRRRSQNSRSASIRRTSMREKTPMALREAREEAQRLRTSATSTDDDDEFAENKKNNHTTTNGIFMEEEQLDSIEIEMKEDKQLHNGDQSQELLHNGDQSQKSLHNGDQSQKSLHNDNQSTKPEGIPSVPVRHSAKKPNQVNSVAPPVTVKPPSVRKESELGPPLNEPTAGNHTSNVNHTSSTNHTSSSNHTAPSTTVQVIAPPADKSNTSSMPMTSAPESTNRNPELTIAATASLSVSTSLSASTERLALSPARSDENLFTPPSGTLADLKKQRAQRAQDNMRFRDTASMNSQNDDYSHSNQSDSENNIVTNGQNKGGHNGIQHKNTYYVAGEMPKRKFTASQTEIIGGAEDTKTSCCTIL